MNSPGNFIPAQQLMNAEAEPLLIQPLAGLTRFDLFLAYADAAHQKLGRKYCERFRNDVRSAARATLTEWKFEMLALPSLADIAAVEAETARIVMIAAESGTDLPAPVQMWITLWSSRLRGAAPMLLLLLSESTNGSKASWSNYSSLEAQTRQWGIDLMVYTSSVSPEQVDKFSWTDARRLAPIGIVTVENGSEAAMAASVFAAHFDETHRYEGVA
jgi:hypothetical protein